MIWHKVSMIALCCFIAILPMADRSVSIAAPLDDEATILEVLINDDQFETLVLKFSETELAGQLAIDGPFTLFAPTDYAFDNLPEDELSTLMADPEMLQATLSHHIVKGKLSAYELAQQGQATTVLGTSLTVIQHGDELMVDGAIIEREQIDVSNGVIYVVNRVLVPPVDALVLAETAPPTPTHVTVVETTTLAESEAMSDAQRSDSAQREDAARDYGSTLSRSGQLLAFVLLLFLLVGGILFMLRRQQ